MNTKLFFRAWILLLAITTIVACKKDKDDDDKGGSSSEGKALMIKNGAQSIDKGESITFQAVFVDHTGAETTATGVSWSSSSSSLSISSSGVVSTTEETTVESTIITASVESDGTTYTASAPLAIQASSAIAVVPAAVMWTTNAGTIPLTVVYMGTGSPSYTYTSSDASVASVSSTGEISFHKAGNCTITVTASGIDGSPSIVVPVVVWGEITVALPITRVEMYYESAKTQAVDMFKGQTVTASAKAYDMDNNEVSATFTWSTTDGSIATVDQSGKITGHTIGTTYVQATASGIVGQAEVNVYPDTVIVVDPFWVSNAQANQQQQYTATFYKFNLNSKTLDASPITAPGPVTWTLLPTAFITDMSDPFNPVTSFTSPATIDANGLLTVKSDANIGDMVLLEASYNSTIGIGVGTMTIGF